MQGLSHNLGESITLNGGAVGPVAGTGSYQNGAWVSRVNFNAALAVILWSTSGGVTGGAVKFRVEDAVDGVGTGAAVFLAEQSIAIPAGPNAAGVNRLGIDLRGARAFVRLSIDSDPTGGTPASIIAGVLAFGRPQVRPA